jgi:hypothetical protein
VSRALAANCDGFSFLFRILLIVSPCFSFAPYDDDSKARAAHLMTGDDDSAARKRADGLGKAGS